ncbi:MAG: hypothetical protein ABIH26_09945 [Candidatus Eisenbacteria bacterium]
MRSSRSLGPVRIVPAAPDLLRVHLYDVTGSRFTDHPERFPLAAEATARRSREDATGRYLFCELQVDLLEGKPGTQCPLIAGGPADAFPASPFALRKGHRVPVPAASCAIATRESGR